jgi:hypothetical protein
MRRFEEAPLVIGRWLVLAGHAEAAVVNGDHVRRSEKLSC